jgi:triphosphatase
MSYNPQTAKPAKPGPKDGREVEWQLACTDLNSVRRWLTEHGTIEGLVLEPRSTLQILDTYLDTDDWRIHRAGFALRIRSESGQSEATLKSLHSASTDVADRRELSEPLESSESESIRHSIGPVGARVHAVSGAHALLPLFEIRTSRQRFAVRRESEARQLGEIALDETVISRPHGEPQTSMQRVEVEALTEVHEPLQSLVKTLRSDCALEAASDTKYSRGLQSVGLAPGPAPEFAPTVVEPSMPMVEVALANLRRYLSAWHLHEPGARLGDNPEELHDLRVAGRRLDAVLRQFRGSLPEPFVRIRPTLKQVLRVLGEVRDLDVALSELESFTGEAPQSDPGAETLRQHLVSERVRARARMLSVLDSASVQKGFHKLAALLSASSAGGQQSSLEPALNVAPNMLRQRYRKVRKSADQLTPGSSMEVYHEVRGHVKKLRYVLESVGVIYGKPADEMLRALRRWQEKLGVQQDAAVASRRLKTLAGTPPKDFPPETLFLMGRLAEHYASSALRARKLHSKGYRKVRGRWKKLRGKFEGRLEASALNDTAQKPSAPAP